MIGVTVAGLAPCPACNVPGVGCAAVTVLTNHVGQAVALAAAALAVAVTWRRAAGGLAAQTVADALCDKKKKGFRNVSVSGCSTFLNFFCKLINNSIAWTQDYHLKYM